MAKNLLKKFIPDSDLNGIQNHIADIEKITSGEIRICFRMRRGWAEKKKTSRELALKEFHKLGMHNTKDATGVLIFILFGERIFEVIADKGINAKISGDKWETVKAHISGEFKKGMYKHGLIKALDEIGDVLKKEFARRGDDKDELSNDIVIE
ncbi:MAG: TPM domain-containing protein [Bacteroidetes bacterium]|nr:TPM domain-containing protein [Bacteroidota bacterium]